MSQFPVAIRIWHWINALVMLVLALTVFLREFWLNKSDNAAIIVKKLSDISITITHDQAIVIAKAIRGEMFQWHIYFGIAAAVLIVARYALMFGGIKITEEVKTMQMKIVKLGYKVLYIIIALSVLTGLLGYYGGDFLGLDKELRHNLFEIHETIAWAIIIFIPLHIAGVFVGENKDEKGVTSKMISG